MTNNATLTYPCPQCRQPTTLTQNPSRPFCSERCQLIDLGAWANEDYKINNAPHNNLEDNTDMML